MAKSGMVDMMLTPEELKEQYGPPTVLADEQEKYPWGLRLNLSADELEKLGIDKLPEVGEPFTIEAVGYVCDVSQSETEGGKPRRSLCIQITDLELEEGVEEDEEDESERGERRANSMYGNGEG